MYIMLDALADGGVYAGIPKEKALSLIAHTMMVSNIQIHTCFVYLLRHACIA